MDLPAPFSPTTAWTLPARDGEIHAVERLDPAVRLAQVDDRRPPAAAVGATAGLAATHRGRRYSDSFSIGSMFAAQFAICPSTSGW